MPDDNALDEIILDLSKKRWQKTAMIIARCLNDPEIEASADHIASRIVHLVDARQLEAQGNLSKWRFSEVRLPRSG